MEFEWDDFKAYTNHKKHGVSFEEAAEVWADSLAIEIVDEATVASEERWIRIGMSRRSRLLVTVFVEMVENTRIRIISARRATRFETRQYEKGVK